MYKKEQLIIHANLTQELACVNEYIDKVESYSAITAPESSLGIVLSEKQDSDIELQKTYLKKRKIMYFLERLPDVNSFLCTECNGIIELERLLVMQKASLCETCACK